LPHRPKQGKNPVGGLRHFPIQWETAARVKSRLATWPVTRLTGWGWSGIAAAVLRGFVKSLARRIAGFPASGWP